MATMLKRTVHVGFIAAIVFSMVGCASVPSASSGSDRTQQTNAVKIGGADAGGGAGGGPSPANPAGVTDAKLTTLDAGLHAAVQSEMPAGLKIPDNTGYADPVAETVITLQDAGAQATVTRTEKGTVKWRVSLPEGPVVSKVAPDARWIAVAGQTKIRVLGADGQIAWQGPIPNDKLPMPLSFLSGGNQLLLPLMSKDPHKRLTAQLVDLSAKPPRVLDLPMADQYGTSPQSALIAALNQNQAAAYRGDVVQYQINKGSGFLNLLGFANDDVAAYLWNDKTLILVSVAGQTILEREVGEVNAQMVSSTGEVWMLSQQPAQGKYRLTLWTSEGESRFQADLSADLHPSLAGQSWDGQVGFITVGSSPRMTCLITREGTLSKCYPAFGVGADGRFARVNGPQGPMVVSVQRLLDEH